MRRGGMQNTRAQKLPFRKTLSGTDVSGVKILKTVPVGRTRTGFLLSEINEAMDHPVSTHFASGKLFLNATPSVRSRAKRAFFKPLVGTSLRQQLEVGQPQVRVLTKLRAAGLPALRAGVVTIGGQGYLAVEPYLRKGGTESKLQPINAQSNHSRPTFLAQLSLKKDAPLIKDLATDLATIANLGLSTPFFDFHGFYRKKDGSLKRVIMDVSEFSEYPFTQENIRPLVARIKQVWYAPWQQKEMQFFANTVVTNIQNEKIRNAFSEAFNQTHFVQRMFGGIRTLLRI